MEILDLISQVHLQFFVNMLPKYLKYSTFSSCFRSIIIVTGDGCLEILITFVFSTFISMPLHLPISFNLSIMPCRTVSSLAISTSSSPYSLYKLNRIGDKQHPCRTHFKFAHFLSPLCPVVFKPARPYQFANQSSFTPNDTSSL